MNAPVSRRLRIAIFNRNFAPSNGGAERYSIALVEQLAARHEIHVFAQRIEHHWPGVTYHRVPCPLVKPRWINQLFFAWWTWRATRQGFDVIHSHENTWHGQVQTVHVKTIRQGLFAGRKGLRLAWRLLGTITSPRLLSYLWLERARIRPQPGRVIVAASEQVRADVLAHYPDVADHLTVITPGVVMPEGPVDKRAARRALGLPESGRLLLFVGNDYTKKGLPTLMQALVSLPSDVRLVVVGNGAHIPAFRHRAEELELSGRVHFAGAVSDTGPWYDVADLLVHPTTEDTYAMVVLEAMAHRLPVVVSGAKWCGISADLQHGQEALILNDPHDPIELAGVLRRLLDNDELRQAMAEKAYAFAARHGWEAVAQQHEAVYVDATQRGSLLEK